MSGRRPVKELSTIAVEALGEVLSGESGRSLAEVREHVAAMERVLTPAQRMKLRGEVGPPLDPDG